MFDFEQFSVYKKSEEFYGKTLKVVASPGIDKNLKDQLKRAALSIVPNIAEGAGKCSNRTRKISTPFQKARKTNALQF